MICSFFLWGNKKLGRYLKEIMHIRDKKSLIEGDILDLIFNFGKVNFSKLNIEGNETTDVTISIFSMSFLTRMIRL